MRKSWPRTFAALVFAIVCLAASLSVSAQQQGSTRYVYDDNGRLHAVISPTGEAVVYEYDAAGNITSVQRLAADALVLFGFAPHEGMPGDQVTFTGLGFGDGVSNVSFNGVAGRVVSVAPSTVVAEVPEGATTGLVTITTPRGSVTTATPFTLAGLRVSPTFVIVDFGQSAQFAAQVFPPTLDQTVTWSVNGVEGGNSTIGTISVNGVYTAPNREVAPVTIRATSVADSSRFAEAQVKLRDPNSLQSAFAAPVAVQFGTVASSQGVASAPLSVRYGNPPEVAAIMGASVSVRRGDSNALTATLTPPVSVRYGDVAGQSSINAAAVSATTGPHVTSISPQSVARGATLTVTFTGVGLFGATNLRFISAATGGLDTSVVATNLSVSADGTTLTATITVAGGAALGNRIVVVATPNGDSMIFNTGTNVIQVVGP